MSGGWGQGGRGGPTRDGFLGGERGGGGAGCEHVSIDAWRTPHTTHKHAHSTDYRHARTHGARDEWAPSDAGLLVLNEEDVRGVGKGGVGGGGLSWAQSSKAADGVQKVQWWIEEEERRGAGEGGGGGAATLKASAGRWSHLL
jgi:hypothetical protein